ncbi:ABC transporter substrate-binding protein [Musicola paradisiaca]|uniref:Substrate-binding region of ABC-type glycine betaine transport system n=1 Tax=Musicola paradisiaca (strain Ech703) TaxID=579405 RepID=C6CA00_MUSP7|nr:ABC transporter substrate-binding protein [Musicola paradisiaca]ACS86422.1 Substrate-binding region of ABC-type glycine betaine transport system [Musicola paradisiaca Ech703]
MSAALRHAGWKLSLIAVCLSAAPWVHAEETPVAIGISGWIGFAPLTLADKAGIFQKHGLKVDLKMIPQKDRHLAVASGAIQCAATTVETYVSWAAAGVRLKQIVQLDKSYGADGLAVRNDVKSVRDLKGKTIGVDAPGTSPYFALAWILDKNGMSIKDVKVATLSPQASAQAFVAGQNDAAMSYEPYLSTIRQQPDKGKIIATTLDYPMVMDTLGCTPDFLKQHPQVGKALVESYFDALDMIKSQPDKSYDIMGAAVKSSGKAFAQSAQYLRWQDREQNRVFFSGEIAKFSEEAAKLLLEAKVIRQKPDLSALYDASYVK